MDAKNKWTSDQQLDSLQNAAVEDLSQSESFNANKKKQLSKDNNLNVTGLRRTLHDFLNSFDEKEQEDFLNQYWIKKLNVKEQEEGFIAEFTTNLLRYFYSLGLMKENGLIGIVLQARMVAEIIHPKPEFNSSKIGINNISDLYEKFTELQYEKYFTQKLNLNIKLLGKGSQITLIDSYKKAHGYLALNALFSENQFCKKLLKNREYEKFSQDELSGIGFIKKFRDSYVADFIHHTFAEYFVAKLYADMLGKETDDPKSNLIREILLRTIFLDRNNLIRIFLEQETQKKPSNIKIKWQEIRECDLLGEMETNKFLSCLNSTSIVRDSNLREFQHDTDETLSELRECLTSSVQRLTDDTHFNIYPSEYHLNHYVIIIKNFFLQFLKVTDIKELQNSLFCLTKINNTIRSRLTLDKCRDFLYQNVDNAIKHYLTQLKLQNIFIFESEMKTIIFKFNNMQDIQNFADMLNELKKAKNSTNEMEKRKHLVKLLDLLIPKRKYSIHDLGKLNNSVYFLFYTYEQSAIEDINFFRIIQKQYQEKILNFLIKVLDSRSGFVEPIESILKNMDVKYLQSFFIGITHHSAIIAKTKSSINTIFQEKKFDWVIREGILIIRLLKILTPEMSEMFNSVSNNFFFINSDYAVQDYTVGVFYNIMYIIDTLKTEKFPQIDKLSLFKIITYSVTFFRKFCDNRLTLNLPFTLNQFKTILELFETILNEQQKPALELRESVEFLFILREAGLKLINIADQKILILDPISEFQFELSSSYKDQIIELIKEKGKLEKTTDFSITQA